MSFTVAIWRDGQLQNPNGPQDPGVIAGQALIDTAAPQSTDADIRQNILRVFTVEHGAANVTATDTPMEYVPTGMKNIRPGQ